MSLLSLGRQPGRTVCPGGHSNSTAPAPKKEGKQLVSPHNEHYTTQKGSVLMVFVIHYSGTGCVCVWGRGGVAGVNGAEQLASLFSVKLNLPNM